MEHQPAPLDEMENNTEKDIDFTPSGEILNDNGLNIDHLGHVVYAEALADQIKRIKTPVTIGLFARWGSGKSFLLKHIQSKISTEKDTYMLSKYICAFVFFLDFIAISVALPLVFALYLQNPGIEIALLFIGVGFLILITFGCHLYGISFPSVIFYALYTKLPIKPNYCSHIRSIPPTHHKIQLKDVFSDGSNKILNKKDKAKNRKEEDNNNKFEQRFIFVNYNAWHFAGCDFLWAGIVKALAEKVEEEFGVFTTRFFRSISLETVPELDRDIHREQHLLLLKCTNEEDEMDAKELRNAMEEWGGPVKDCQLYTNWAKYNGELKNVGEDKERVWVTEYLHVSDAHKAFQNLNNLEEIKVWFAAFPKRNNNSSNSKYDEGKVSFDYRIGNILLSIGYFCVITASVVFSVLAFQSQLIEATDKEDESIVAKILSVVPGAAALVVLVVRTIVALSNSQKSRISRILQGAKKNVASELGFMHKIEEEVASVTNLILTVKLVHRISYKVVITVDDLDRVPLPKVKSVLEAVNILLSNRSSPFVCIIAVDTRVAINCFALEAAIDNGRPIVNGHEYLKKIINVPFCLPEIDDEAKQMYILGLIEEADIETESPKKPNEDKNDVLPLQAVADVAYTQPSCPADDSVEEDADATSRLNNATEDSGQQVSEKRPRIDLVHFLFHCRYLMYNNKTLRRHMQSNPRNIKRIFNVISITAYVINAIQSRKGCDFKSSRDKNFSKRQHDKAELIKNREENEKFAKDILYWILLTDQWPFRISYMLEVIEDADQREEAGKKDEAITDDVPLLNIYKWVLLDSEKAEVESHKQLLCLDDDVDVLYDLLEKTKDFMTKGKAKELMKYTVNLDTNLRKSIALGRSCQFRAGDKIIEHKHAPIAHQETPRLTGATNMENKDAAHDGSDVHWSLKTIRSLVGNGKLSNSQPLVVQLTEKEEILPMPAGEYIKLKMREYAS